MRISDWSSDVCSSDLVTDDGAEVDELVAADPFALVAVGRLFGAVSSFGTLVAVVVVTSRSSDERQPEEESKELHAPALESHVVDLLVHGQDTSGRRWRGPLLHMACHPATGREGRAGVAA